MRSCPLFCWLPAALVAAYPWALSPPSLWAEREGVWYVPKLLLLLLLAVLLAPYGLRRLTPRLAAALLAAQLFWLALSSGLSYGSTQDWSFWLLGPLNRTDGPLYQSALFLFALGLLGLLEKEPCLERALPVFLLLSALYQGVLWLWQRSGLDPLAIPLGYLPQLPPGTIGNPGMAAGLALPLVPLALGLWVRRGEGYWLLAALGLATALGGLANRTALIALVAGLSLLAALHRERRLWAASLAALALAFLSSASWPTTLAVKKDLADSRTLETRLEMWRISLSLLAQDPKTLLVGLGPLGLQRAMVEERVPLQELLRLYQLEYDWPPPERFISATPLWEADDPPTSRTYLLRYNVEGLPKYQKSEGQKEFLALQRLSNWDKAHNAYLDKALAYGLPYGVLWTLFLLYPTLSLLRSRSPMATGMAAGLLSLALYYLAWFPTPGTEPWHFVLAALAWRKVHKPE